MTPETVMTSVCPPLTKTGALLPLRPIDLAAAAPIATPRIGFRSDLPDYQDARRGGKGDVNGCTGDGRVALRVAGSSATGLASQAPERGRWDLAQGRLVDVGAGELVVATFGPVTALATELGVRDRLGGGLALANRVGTQIGCRETASREGVVAHVAAIHLVVDDVIREHGVRARQGDGGAAERRETGRSSRSRSRGQARPKPSTHWAPMEPVRAEAKRVG